jgi:hypothetical protein
MYVPFACTTLSRNVCSNQRVTSLVAASRLPLAMRISDHPSAHAVVTALPETAVISLMRALSSSSSTDMRVKGLATHLGRKCRPVANGTPE